MKICMTNLEKLPVTGQAETNDPARLHVPIEWWKINQNQFVYLQAVMYLTTRNDDTYTN